MDETLLPCPFCGGEAELVRNSSGSYFVRCADRQCAAKTRLFHENESGARASWNRRAERTCHVERVSTPYHAGPPRCSACMMPLEPLANFCSYCGARVVDD